MIRAALIVALAGLALAQTPASAPAPLISAFYSLDNGATNAYRWLAIDPPLALTVDAAGRPHLGLPKSLTVLADGVVTGSASAVDVRAGYGLLIALSAAPGAIMLQPGIDPAVTAHRVTPPAAAGACDTVGAGAWAADAGYFYFCVPGADASGFVWARVALATAW